MIPPLAHCLWAFGSGVLLAAVALGILTIGGRG